MDSLPALPEGWSAPNNFKAIGSVTEPIKRAVEPVGPGFLAHARRILRNRTFSEDEKLEAARNVKSVEDNANEEDDEPEDPEMLRHDPKDWKSVDQYAVLGLSKHRWQASEEQIRNAHRRKVLKHHPDKKAAEGAGDDDGFFKLIQKAFETLTDPVKRRQFDSVDEKASSPAPTKKSTGDFFDRWTKFFESEGRFSTKQPVPTLGTLESSKEEVDAFYAFWYHFDSWRSFEWLDEDVPDDSSNRDNKRHIEKKNKASRTKHKKDDNARVSKAVDTAMAEDPRIRMFKEAEKKAKAQRKWERDAGSREAAEKAAKEKEEADKKAAADAAAAKTNAAEAKKAKEAAKSAKKKNKRVIRGSVKDVNYFVTGEPAAADVANILTDVDNLIEALDDLALSDAAATLAEPKPDAVRAFFTSSLKEKNIAPKYFN